MPNLLEDTEVSRSESFTAIEICSDVDVTEALSPNDTCFPMSWFVIDSTTLSKDDWINGLMRITMGYQYHFSAMRA